MGMKKDRQIEIYIKREREREREQRKSIDISFFCWSNLFMTFISYERNILTRKKNRNEFGYIQFPAVWISNHVL